MSDYDDSGIFKSGQWRICSNCLASIKPNDPVGYLWGEVSCVPCMVADIDLNEPEQPEDDEQEESESE